MGDDLYANRIDFYRDTICNWIPDRSASILVVGGGPNDRKVFADLGFTRVTLTNVDTNVERLPTLSQEVSVADAENLPYENDSFDFAVTHAVLHHCASPHRGLLELYRVARQAAIFFEARDSLTMRIADRLGLCNNYELSAVIANGGQAGGVRDSAIPNYVYRWTEREVEKTIASYAPHSKHSFQYARGFGYPCVENDSRSGREHLKRSLIAAYRLFAWIFPSQANLFACRIAKPSLPQDLQPWVAMTARGLAFRSPGMKVSRAQTPAAE